MTSTPPSYATAPVAGGVHTVRRVITYILLIIMVTTAAFGLTELLHRLFTIGEDRYYYDNFGLATALASTLIAGPFAAILWWLVWRKSAMVRDRNSDAWPVYIVIMSTMALLIFSVALFTWIAGAIVHDSGRYSLALAIVWGTIWLWHYWMWRHPTKGPTKMAGLAPALASFIGLIFGAGGLIFTIAKLIDFATGTTWNIIAGGDTVGQVVAQSLVWAIGGGVLWAWHWFVVGVREHTSGFSHVLLAFITGGASLALVAFGVSRTLSVILQLVFGISNRFENTLAPLGISLACALVGALVLVYHSRIFATQPAHVGAATRLVSSAVALAFTATGIGMMVDALLEAASNVIVGGSGNTLFVSGLSTFLVGGVLWWVLWQPLSASAPERTANPGRRAYLVVIFGVSALVALITLIVIGTQAFGLMLDGDHGASFLERSRHAIGLFTATLLVAVYHFTIWMKDRASGVTEERTRAIERVTLVTFAGNEEMADAVREMTGVYVRVLHRTDALAGKPDTAALVAELEGVVATHVLVVVGVNGTIDVIKLAD